MSARVLDYGCATLNKFSSLLLSWLLAGSAAHADDWSGSLGLSSDYRLRGISYSDRQATPTLDATYRLDTGWAFGAGLAALDRDAGRRRLLLSASLSHAWQFDADWSGELGLARSHYTGILQRRAYDSDELSATLVWRGRLSGSLMAAPRYARTDPVSGERRSAAAYIAELSLRQPLIGALALDAGLGYLDSHAVSRRGYGYGNVGLAWARGPAQVFLSRIASQAAQREFASPARARPGWVASLLWEL